MGYVLCQALMHRHVKYIENSVFIANLLHEKEIVVFVFLRYILKLGLDIYVVKNSSFVNVLTHLTI